MSEVTLEDYHPNCPPWENVHTKVCLVKSGCRTRVCIHLLFCENAVGLLSEGDGHLLRAELGAAAGANYNSQAIRAFSMGKVSTCSSTSSGRLQKKS